MHPAFLGNYTYGLNKNDARHNWFDSIEVAFPEGNALGHLHPNSGGGESGGWVANTAFVADTVVMKAGSSVSGNAKVFGDVVIEGNCNIYGNAVVFGAGTIGNGSDTVSIFNKAKVFGSPTVSSLADIYSTMETEGWVFGDVIIQGEVSVTEGDLRGSVFGSYTTDQGSEYQDTKYPTNPQIHGSGQTLKLTPPVGTPIESITGFAGDTPLTELEVLPKSVTTVIEEATEELELPMEVDEIAELANAAIEAGADADSVIASAIEIVKDGVPLEVGTDFDFIDELGNVVSTITQNVKLAVVAAVGAVVTVTQSAFTYLNDNILTPGVDFVKDFANNTVTKLNSNTQLPENFAPTDVLETFDLPNVSLPSFIPPPSV
jgi:hypothetical protein